jgi:hypothetical protein
VLVEGVVNAEMHAAQRTKMEKEDQLAKARQEQEVGALQLQERQYEQTLEHMQRKQEQQEQRVEDATLAKERIVQQSAAKIVALEHQLAGQGSASASSGASGASSAAADAADDDTHDVGSMTDRERELAANRLELASFYKKHGVKRNAKAVLESHSVEQIVASHYSEYRYCVQHVSSTMCMLKLSSHAVGFS